MSEQLSHSDDSGSRKKKYTGRKKKASQELPYSSRLLKFLISQRVENTNLIEQFLDNGSINVSNSRTYKDYTLVLNSYDEAKLQLINDHAKEIFGNSGLVFLMRHTPTNINFIRLSSYDRMINEFIFFLEYNKLLNDVLIFKVKGGIPLTKFAINDSSSNEILKKLKENYEIVKNEKVEFWDIVPILKDIRIVDFIVDKKISFTSQKNSDLAETISDMLVHISNRKALGRGGNKSAGETAKDLANSFAVEIGPEIEKLELDGYKTLQSKADFFNDRNIKTHRGKEWTATAIKNTYERWLKINEDEKAKSKKPKP